MNTLLWTRALMKKECLNPKCKKMFTPYKRYGDRQLICGSEECKKWYKKYWSQTRKTPRGLPDDLLGKIKKACKDMQYRTLIITARDTGLRKGELLGLYWRDILDHDGKVRGYADIRGQWDDTEGFRETKTDRSRVAYFRKESRNALESLHTKRNPKGNERVFPYTKKTAYDRFVKLQRALGIVNAQTGYPYRFHDLRHSLGREYARKGRLDLAKKALGHSNVNTTAIYAELSPDETLEDMENA